MIKATIANKVLPADMPEVEYKSFTSQAEKKRKRLLKSIEKNRHFCSKWVVSLKWDEKELGIQSEYSDIPFRMEDKGDSISTVATSGCAILIAKFLELFLRQRSGANKNYSIDELAEMAVSNGYCEYKQLADGSWKAMGMKHVFFDRFIPSLYGFEVERAASIESVFESLKECGFAVLLVSNIYKNNPESTDSHFIIVCGYDDKEGKFFVYDPEYPEQIWVEYSRVLPALRNAWLVYE